MDINVAYVVVVVVVALIAITAFLVFQRADLVARLPFKTTLKVRGSRDAAPASSDMLAEDITAHAGSIRGSNRAGGGFTARRLEAGQDVDLTNDAGTTRRPKDPRPRA